MASNAAGRGQHRRRPRPNETMVPVGFESVAHPVFMMLRREIPLPPDDDGGDGQKRRPVAFGEPWEATDEALAGKGKGEGPTKSRGSESKHDAPSPAQRGSTPDGGGGSTEPEDEPELDCAICQDRMADPVTCCLQNCNHSYCRACIKRWLSISQRCPLCQQGVTWLLGFSSATTLASADKSGGSGSGSGNGNGNGSLRYTLLAVGPDQALLERQPFPAPSLLQDARAKQLRIHRAMERRRRQEQREHKQQEQKERERRKRARREEKEKGGGGGSPCSSYTPGCSLRQRQEEAAPTKRSAAAILEGELARLDEEIARQSRKLTKG